MAFFIVSFVAVVLLFGLLFFEISRLDEKAKAKGYGPISQISGEPCANGRLNCYSHKAPTLGQTLLYNFALRLYTDDGNVTGIFEHIKHPKEFSGSLFLSLSGGRVKGRSLMGGLQVCEGALGTGGARLVRGLPKGGIWASSMGVTSTAFGAATFISTRPPVQEVSVATAGCRLKRAVYPAKCSMVHKKPGQWTSMYHLAVLKRRLPYWR